MPAPDHAEANYFAADAWPRQGVRPDQGMLPAARRTQSALPTAIGNLVQIIGCNRETVVRAGIADDEFQYVLGNDGDGTVPLALARLPKPDTYYVEEDHGSLPNSFGVAAAVADILNSGATEELPTAVPATRGAATRTVRERELRALAAEARAGIGRSSARPSLRQAREVLAEFASPSGRSRPIEVKSMAALSRRSPARQTAPIASSSAAAASPLDITLVYGSIVEVEASAYVLGLFSQVSPTGAAGPIDALMKGAISQMMHRRMFAANIGEITFLPRAAIPCAATWWRSRGWGRSIRSARKRSASSQKTYCVR